ncbi:hypothetical protein SeMB42_g01705 [Synchytrium endobioticum]|uniref:Ribosome production factor 2 homolog n=1 Tax=Synchytrium endobioticum TaxID=286115 RepID=A0A507DK65_9FUNG|nr:hypothetical protein SeLEV6574_g03886 [Synchytrium endobioticum]TPX52013.1 hypothetical protein SeMB42_g01705 [Synchytrium endobioticum]
MIRTPKPKTAKGKRVYEARQPKIHEGVKTALFMKGTSSSHVSSNALKDLYQLKRPHGILLSRKNDVHPFDDIRPIEFLCEKSDAGLFAFTSHSKKRPHNLVLGRMFNREILDLCEFGIDEGIAMSDIKGIKSSFGNRPLITFHGDAFTTHPEMIHVRSLMLDFFRGVEEEHVDLAGLEHIISITAATNSNSSGVGGNLPTKLFIRVYRISLFKSNSKLPRAEIEEMGPRLDLVLRRTRWADEQKRKLAMWQPAELKVKKVKNVDYDAIGDKFGRIHLGKQDLSKLQTRKMKGLKRSRPDADDDDEQHQSEAGDNKRVALPTTIDEDA